VNCFRLQRILRFALPIGLFLIIFGAKLLVIEKFGSDLPFWDQWDAEGREIFVPYFDGNLTLAPFFAPHNEHRIAFTRLLNLGLLLVNGQWDARMQCIVNAALHAAILVALFAWVRRHLGLLAAMATFLILLAVAALPIVWENTLAGFQSQFYFLMGFSVAAMWLFLSSPAWSGRWWLAIACACAAMLSMGSGFFCVLPVLALPAGQLWPGRTNWRARRPTLIACCAIAVSGWRLRTEVPRHAPLHAGTAGDFLMASLHNAAWPAVHHPWRALYLYLPLTTLFLLWVRRKRPGQKVHQFILAGGVWALLQIAAVAYSRGAGGALPAVRYGDAFSIGIIFNGLALVVLFKELWPSGYFCWLPFLLLAAWSITLINGVTRSCREAVNTDLPAKKAWLESSETNVQAYLSTGHFAQTGRFNLPYFQPDVLAHMLDQPMIREILPASVRLPLVLDRLPASGSSFSIGAISPATPPLAYRKVWGSFTTGGRSTQGEWHSRPLPAAHEGFWEFEIAGDLGSPGQSLQLVSSHTGTVLADIKPATPAGDAWLPVCIPAPHEACTLVASETSPTGWFAFSEPVEMATGSWLAWRLTRQARWVLAAGCGLTLAGLAAALRGSNNFS
jgi:hypothetical protein